MRQLRTTFFSLFVLSEGDEIEKRGYLRTDLDIFSDNVRVEIDGRFDRVVQMF